MVPRTADWLQERMLAGAALLPIFLEHGKIQWLTTRAIEAAFEERNPDGDVDQVRKQLATLVHSGVLVCIESSPGGYGACYMPTPHTEAFARACSNEQLASMVTYFKHLIAADYITSIFVGRVCPFPEVPHADVLEELADIYDIERTRRDEAADPDGEEEGD